jgi:hypothetical protein
MSSGICTLNAFNAFLHKVLNDLVVQWNDNKEIKFVTRVTLLANVPYNKISLVARSFCRLCLASGQSGQYLRKIDQSKTCEY